MLSAYRLTALLAIGSFVAVSSAQSLILDGSRNFVVGQLNFGTNVTGAWENGGVRIRYSGFDEMFVIGLPATTNWSGQSHVNVVLRNNETLRPAELELAISSGAGVGWLTSRVALAPGETVTVSMPFADAQSMGLMALPKPIGSTVNQLNSVGNIVSSAPRGFFVWNKSRFAADVTLLRVESTLLTIPTRRIVDVFGQQSQIQWDKKISTTTQLRAPRSLDPKTATLPYASDPFGGVLGGKNYGTAPRFRTVKDGDRWHMITPAGNRFFSLGVNEVGAHAWTRVAGREALFSFDTRTASTNWPSAWSVRDGALGYMPYAQNLHRKYGTDWRRIVEPIFLNRLKTWGFNTLGINSWDSMGQKRNVANTFGGHIEGSHSRIWMYGGKAMHDVYDPSFVPSIRSTIQERLATTQSNHDFNIGMFLDNELPWGMNIPNHRVRYALAVGALNAPANQPAHLALIQQLKSKYPTIGALNLAWGTNYPSWLALDSTNVPLPNVFNAAMQADFRTYGFNFAQRYFRLVKEQLVAMNYQGLYLGCRFNVYTPEVLEAAKPFVDVMSFNIYNADLDSSNFELRELDHPILISEFCFGANDQGRVGMGLYPTQTEASRVASLRHFVQSLKSWNNVVGAHWYRWEDFPVTGKVDGDNMSMGLQSVTDAPYTDLTSEFARMSNDYNTFLKTVR